MYIRSHKAPRLYRMSQLQAKTKNQILETLWASPALADAISKVQPEHIREELRSEMFAALCELPDERLQSMSDEGYLLFYTLRMMLTMSRSKRSTFYKKFRRQDEPWDETIAQEPDEPYMDLWPFYKNAYKDLPFVEREILKIYSEVGSMQEVSNVTFIPFRTVKEIIAKAKSRMEHAVQKHVKMEITLSIPLQLVVIKTMDTDELYDLVENYATHIKRKMQEINTHDRISMIMKPETCHPLIVKIKDL